MLNSGRREFLVGATALLACTAQGDDGASGGDSEGTTDGSSADASSSPTAGNTVGQSESSGSSTSPTTTMSGTSDDSSTASDESGPGSSDGSGSDSSDSGNACEPTPVDIEGPFYRPGIPIGGNLDVHGDSGLPLLLEGRVRDTDCAPIAGAIVEIWHATPLLPEGEPGDVNATYDATAAYRYYGQVATAEDGSYAFQTLRPGWYLNGENYRPAHVHLKVWVRDVQRLVTQLYFVGDPFNEGDAWFNPDMALDPDDAGLAQLDIVV